MSWDDAQVNKLNKTQEDRLKEAEKLNDIQTDMVGVLQDILAVVTEIKEVHTVIQEQHVLIQEHIADLRRHGTTPSLGIYGVQACHNRICPSFDYRLTQAAFDAAMQESGMDVHTTDKIINKTDWPLPPLDEGTEGNP